MTIFDFVPEKMNVAGECVHINYTAIQNVLMLIIQRYRMCSC